MRATILALIVVFGMGLGVLDAQTPPRQTFEAVRLCMQMSHYNPAPCLRCLVGDQYLCLPGRHK